MTKSSPAFVVAKITEDKVTPVYDVSMELFISDQNTYNQAGDLLKLVKTYAKSFKFEKDKILKPVKDMVKAYEATLKPTEQKLKALEILLKGKMLSYNEEQSAIAAEQAKKLEQKIESGYISNPETMMNNMAKIETVNNAAAGVTESEIRKVRITDLSMIPIEYFQRERVIEALMVELRKDVLGNKSQGIEPIDVPGTETYTEKSLSL